jgi:hypothetical protein
MRADQVPKNVGQTIDKYLGEGFCIKHSLGSSVPKLILSHCVHIIMQVPQFACRIEHAILSLNNSFVSDLMRCNFASIVTLIPLFARRM